VSGTVHPHQGIGLESPASPGAGRATAVLISTYELGHQPFGLASPAAWLRREGIPTRLYDLAKEKLDEPTIRTAMLVAFHLPMHTATRLAAPVIKRIRAENPAARICAYGLYAPLNAEWLRSIGVDDVLGGEFEEELTEIAREACRGDGPRQGGGPSPNKVRPGITQRTNPAQYGPDLIGSAAVLPKLHFLVPDRSGLPPLNRYSTLVFGDGTRRVVGHTEASRGCRHLCRHCPVVPVYNGQFRVVSQDVVLSDIEAQVAGGAEHITFGDPDFFNGPTHAVRIVEQLHQRHPAVTYDVTIKVEHLLEHRELIPRLGSTGCLFITSAVESIDDRVLAILDKGHTREDFVEAVRLTRESGVALAPTFVAFHPWTTLEGYADLLQLLADLELVNHVAPIQLAIRLLIPGGSRLLDVQDVAALVGPFDPNTLTYRWAHTDPRVDQLQREIADIVGRRLVSDRAEVFGEIARLVHERTGRPLVRATASGVWVPHLDEPWYCCAEPNPDQLRLV
jgi:radical SAM superfamily enzyme YgiQ (UPF0313 family)